MRLFGRILRIYLEFYLVPPVRKLSSKIFLVLILIQFTKLLVSISVTRRIVSGCLMTNWKGCVKVIILASF